MKIGVNEIEYLIKLLKHKKIKIITLVLVINVVIMMTFIITSVSLLHMILVFCEILKTRGINLDFSINYSLVAIVTGIEYVMMIILMKKMKSKYSKSLKEELDSLFQIVSEERVHNVISCNALTISIVYGAFLLVGLYTASIPNDLNWWLVAICAIVIGICGEILFYINYSSLLLDVYLYYAFNDTELRDLIIKAGEDKNDCIVISSKQMHGKVSDLVYYGVFTVRNSLAISELEYGTNIEMWLSERAKEVLTEYKESYYVVYINSDEKEEIFESKIITLEKTRIYSQGDILILNEIKGNQIENEYKIQVVDIDMFLDDESVECQDITFTIID